MGSIWVCLDTDYSRVLGGNAVNWISPDSVDTVDCNECLS